MNTLLISALLCAHSVYGQSLYSISELKTTPISDTLTVSNFSLFIGPNYFGGNGMFEESIEVEDISYLAPVRWNNNSWLKFYSLAPPSIILQVNNQTVYAGNAVCSESNEHSQTLTRKIHHGGVDNTIYTLSYKCSLFKSAQPGTKAPVVVSQPRPKSPVVVSPESPKFASPQSLSPQSPLHPSGIPRTITFSPRRKEKISAPNLETIEE